MKIERKNPFSTTLFRPDDVCKLGQKNERPIQQQGKKIIDFAFGRRKDMAKPSGQGPPHNLICSGARGLTTQMRRPKNRKKSDAK
jgi:hypothetical protein